MPACTAEIGRPLSQNIIAARHDNFSINISMEVALTDKSWRLRVIYSALLLTAYFGFFIVSAWSPSTMAHTISASSPVTVAMALGAGIIAGSVALTGLYMAAADKIVRK
jgi:uncharacterized membrane protein (DUF485 family)